MIAHVGPSLDYCRQRPTLPHSLPCSTIGGSRLNFRVRNGNGCDPAPMTTGILVAGSRGPGLLTAWAGPLALHTSGARACPAKARRATADPRQSCQRTIGEL